MSEYLFPQNPEHVDRTHRWKTNFGLGILNGLIASLTPALTVCSAQWATSRGAGILNWVAAPLWLALPGTLLIRSLAQYAFHRYAHKSSFLWRVHRVHHCDVHLDASSALRFHPLEMIANIAFVVPIIMVCGLSPGILLIYECVEIIVGIMTHTNLRVPNARKHVIIIGVSRLSALYMKFLDAIAPGAHEIIAVLDEAADSWGRSVNGVRVMGPASELEAIIEEFAVHGVQADRVVAGMNPCDMPEGVLAEIRHVCARHDIELGFVPELFGLTMSPEPEALTREQAAFEASLEVEPPLTLPAYFKAKRYIDFAAALALLAVLGPFWLIATAIALFDVGMPVFFWQQRMGVGSRRFLLYKFRTLRTPFDETGRKLSDDERLSPIGRFMRRSRLDELPQLLNILEPWRARSPGASRDICHNSLDPRVPSVQASQPAGSCPPAFCSRRYGVIRGTSGRINEAVSASSRWARFFPCESGSVHSGCGGAAANVTPAERDISQIRRRPRRVGRQEHLMKAVALFEPMQ